VSQGRIWASQANRADFIPEVCGFDAVSSPRNRLLGSRKYPLGDLPWGSTVSWTEPRPFGASGAWREKKDEVASQQAVDDA
jgi:hypothetical protein